MTEILRTTYAQCMQCAPMTVHPQYIQVWGPILKGACAFVTLPEPMASLAVSIDT